MTLKLTKKSIIMGALTVLLTALSSCRHGSSLGTRAEVLTSESIHDISAHDVISWAHLDDTLRYHLDRVGVGEADGKSILADYVIVQNGGEIVAFVRKHGYQSFVGPMAVRKNRNSIEVDVEITGKDGAKAIMTLFADGTMHGVG
jgi:hypothetical protein